MYNLIRGNLFSSLGGMIIVPISTSGTISKSFHKGLAAKNINFSLTKQAYNLGDVEFDIVQTHSTTRFIAYACTVQENYGSYAAIRLIGKKIRQFANENEVTTISSPVLGIGAGKLDPVKSFNILINSFFEKEKTSTVLEIYVYDRNIYRTLISCSIDKSSSSGKLVLEAELPKIFEDDSIKKIIYKKGYYYEYADNVFEEYLQFGKTNKPSPIRLTGNKIAEPFYIGNNRKYFNNILDKFKSSGLTFGNFLVNFPDTGTGQYFFKLCGQLTAYINYNASFKNKWNEYPDKRVLAYSNVQQVDWIINLISFKSEKENVENIPDKNIRNAFEYLLEPESNLTILSEDHRKLVFENILSQEYNGKNSLSALFSFFDNLGIPCHNSRNRGALYSKILYLPYIKKIWTQDSFETPDTSDDLWFASNLIFDNLKQKSTSLDLGNCGLTDISMLPELFECIHLEELILSNEWGESDGDLWRLNTSKNSEKKNILKSLPAEIGKLKKLKRLICGGDWNYNKEQNNDTAFGKWGIESLSALTGLDNLEYLNASNNSIDSLNGISNLKKLKTSTHNE